mmetsp:Transcript_20412/g.22834  ORF Transcript_20412/g.22834 Transcript_20412/m.22834 type:complete len:299 (-) Transcript_20412:46-942(-)
MVVLLKPSLWNYNILGFILLLNATGFLSTICDAYPIIFEVPKDGSKCFKFNIPPTDDAHMVFMSIPSEIESIVEEFYVDQIMQLRTNRKTSYDPLSRSFSKTVYLSGPTEVKEAAQKFLETNGGVRSSLRLKVQKPSDQRPIRQQELNYFAPIIINHMERYQKGNKNHHLHPQYGKPATNIEGYSVCFENQSKKQVHAMFDTVFVSQPVNPDTDKDETMTKDHLSPMEEELDSCISATKSIISEMRYLEKREDRMRVTTHSIKSRIRWLSYMSVGVLFLVSFLQVTYLKRYFKKKKLM